MEKATTSGSESKIYSPISKNCNRRACDVKSDKPTYVRDKGIKLENLLLF